jgi:hypothetical protein
MFGSGSRSVISPCAQNFSSGSVANSDFKLRKIGAWDHALRRERIHEQITSSMSASFMESVV